MIEYVERTCHEVIKNASGDLQETQSYKIEKWRGSSAYILLAPPGSGKTTIFELEAERQGGYYVSTRDFITLDLETVNTPIFIDGLDEQRAGQIDGRTALDKIRTKLIKLNKPKFRLSCREADWLGSNDSENIKKVSYDNNLKILQLDHLKPEDIRQILKSDEFNIRDPDQFISQAKDNGLYDLLKNPQSLKMLALAIGSKSNWPNNRKEVFELACRSLLKEHNYEHLIATISNRSNINDLMDDCGQLCAIFLLTGLEGFADNGNQNHILLDEISGMQQRSIKFCLQSKLFSSPSPGKYIPIHRQIAEFLAGRYLSKLVNEGLSPSRILALITGYDARVVSELRGLTAWFASHNKPSRGEIFTRDPLGTVLYGDVTQFSNEEKKKLLERLKEEAKIFPSLMQVMKLDTRIGDLITPDMGSEICKILNSISYSNTDQSFLLVLLEALQQGKPIPSITNNLVKIICCEGWWTRIRLLAVDVLVKYQKGNLVKLKEICEEIYSGKIIDPLDSLLGHVLSILYPEEISELEILKYLKVPRESSSLLAQYEYFWRYQLPDKSNHKQLGLILDQLADKFYELPLDSRSKGIAQFGSRCYVSIILYYFLQKSEDDIDLDKLFKWLGVTYKANSTHTLQQPDRSTELHQWLKNHPDIWKTLLSKSVNECSKKSESYNDLVHCLFKEKNGRLFDFVPPSDFCDWCLDQAIIAENPIVAKWYITQVADYFHVGSCNENINLKTISNALENKGNLYKIFNERIEFSNNRQSAEINPGWPNRGLQQRPNWHDQVKPYEKEIRNNSVSAVLLYNLAEVYFGEFLDLEGNSPRARLEYVLNGDQDLVDAVISSFSESLLRNDLPTVSKIIVLDSQCIRHPLSLPLLAGFEEKSKDGELFLPKLEDKYLRLCVAIYITSILNKYLEQQYPPSWYNWILSNHPRIVADVLVEYALTTLRSKTSITKHLYDLSFSKEYEEVAKFAAFRILKRFPVRCNSRQLTELGYLFFAARKHHSQYLDDLVNVKLTHKSMNIEQRIYWLALGICIDPETYIKTVIDEIPRNERRIRYFANTLEEEFFSLQPDLEVRLRVEVIKLIIKHLGSSFFPYQLISGKAVFVSREMTIADIVKDYINQLSIIPSEKATQALKELVSDKQLLRWNSYLEPAYQNQMVTRREAEFKYCNLENVLGTIENKKTSNSADLVALTFEFLNEIAENIHNSSTSDWRQFWNVDKHGKPENPRPEDTCRDNLLSDLKPKLQKHDIDGQPEGTYVNDKRSDIRVSYTPYNIPIEIKRSCHRDLWTSIQSQLINKYTRDPGSEGYGIYLVFWFGESESCKPQISPKGTRPLGPDELREQLIDSLTSEQKNKIKVCVIDVSNQKIT